MNYDVTYVGFYFTTKEVSTALLALCPDLTPAIIA